MSTLFAKAARDMWPQVLRLYSDTARTLVDTFRQRTRGFNPSADELAAYEKLIRERVWEAVRRKIKDETTDTMFQARLRQRSVFISLARCSMCIHGTHAYIFE